MLGWLNPPKSFSSLMSTLSIISARTAARFKKGRLTPGKVPTEFSNCNLTPLEFTDEHILEATAPNFFELRKPVRRDFTIL